MGLSDLLLSGFRWYRRLRGGTWFYVEYPVAMGGEGWFHSEAEEWFHSEVPWNSRILDKEIYIIDDPNRH